MPLWTLYLFLNSTKVDFFLTTENTQLKKSDKPEEKQIVISLLFVMPSNFNEYIFHFQVIISFKKSTCLLFLFL